MEVAALNPLAFGYAFGIHERGPAAHPTFLPGLSSSFKGILVGVLEGAVEGFVVGYNQAPIGRSRYMGR